MIKLLVTKTSNLSIRGNDTILICIFISRSTVSFVISVWVMKLLGETEKKYKPIFSITLFFLFSYVFPDLIL